MNTNDSTGRRPLGLSTEKAEQLKAMWLSDISVMEIAQRLELSQSAVEKFRRALGLEPRDAATVSRIEKARVRPPRCSLCHICLDYAGDCPRRECKRYSARAQFGERAERTLAGVA